VAEELSEEFFSMLEHCLVVEQSQQGQLHRIIRMWTNVPSHFTSFAKSGANPFSPVEIVAKLAAFASIPSLSTQ
jgi:hypothetical protein